MPDERHGGTRLMSPTGNASRFSSLGGQLIAGSVHAFHIDSHHPYHCVNFRNTKETTPPVTETEVENVGTIVPSSGH